MLHKLLTFLVLIMLWTNFRHVPKNSWFGVGHPIFRQIVVFRILKVFSLKVHRFIFIRIFSALSCTYLGWLIAKGRKYFICVLILASIITRLCFKVIRSRAGFSLWYSFPISSWSTPMHCISSKLLQLQGFSRFSWNRFENVSRVQPTALPPALCKDEFQYEQHFGPTINH